MNKSESAACLTDDQLAIQLYCAAYDYFRVVDRHSSARFEPSYRWRLYTLEAQRRGRSDLAEAARDKAKQELKGKLP